MVQRTKTLLRIGSFLFRKVIKMKKVYVNELNKHIGEEISFSGFVDTIRDKKWVMFVILRDSTGKVQMTIEKSEEKNAKLLVNHKDITALSIYANQLKQRRKCNGKRKDKHLAQGFHGFPPQFEKICVSLNGIRDYHGTTVPW